MHHKWGQQIHPWSSHLQKFSAIQNKCPCIYISFSALNLIFNSSWSQSLDWWRVEKWLYSFNLYILLTFLYVTDVLLKFGSMICNLQYLLRVLAYFYVSSMNLKGFDVLSWHASPYFSLSNLLNLKHIALLDILICIFSNMWMRLNNYLQFLLLFY